MNMNYEQEQEHAPHHSVGEVSSDLALDPHEGSPEEHLTPEVRE